MNLRIVACDDEAHISRAVSMKLRKAGFDVETAPDGQAALEAIQRQSPALLVTDCQMPRMNGIELCRHLRAQEEYADLPIILLTAKGFELDHEQLKDELKLAAIVMKPFSPRELVGMVREILGVDEPLAARTCSPLQS